MAKKNKITSDDSEDDCVLACGRKRSITLSNGYCWICFGKLFLGLVEK